MSQQIIETKIAEKLAINQDEADKAFNAVLEALKETVAEIPVGEKLIIRNLGTFSVKHKEAYTGRNPKTGEQIPVAASNRLSVKLSSTLKDAVK